MGGESEGAGTPGEVLSLESVTADARRRALEAIAFGPEDRHRQLELLALGPLGLAVVDPVGERFAGEAQALACIAAVEAEDRGSATQQVVAAALDVWETAHEGIIASRTALLRAVAAFLPASQRERGCTTRRPGGERIMNDASHVEGPEGANTAGHEDSSRHSGYLSAGWRQTSGNGR